VEIAREADDLDGVVAAPEHHRVLFENDRVRVVETSIPVGDVTRLHTHMAPAVQYVVAGSHFVRRGPSGEVMLDTRDADPPFVWPRVMWSESNPAHTLENTGDQALVVISVELRGEPHPD
jgi:hypothetical protein